MRAGPAGPGSSSIVGGPGIRNGIGAGLAEYLLAHTTHETWILAVPSSMSGADLIIETGKPVMSLGGFAGSDQILDVTSLITLIKEGKVRYFLTEGSGGFGGMNNGNSEIFSWIGGHCTAIPAGEYQKGAIATPVTTVSPDPGRIATALPQTLNGTAGNRDSDNTGTVLYDCLGSV
jgi:hypothetical protein